jgi:hypothetical protein
MAGLPSAQVTWQPLSAQCTTQLPEHLTVQELTLLQVTTLSAPTATEQFVAS